MTTGQRSRARSSDAVERVAFSDAVALFAGGFCLGILFNLGDLLIADFITKNWPPVFFFGVPVVALLLVVLPARSRPFALTAALFLGLVFGFLGGTLLLLNFYGT